jgi:hypothetical protein
MAPKKRPLLREIEKNIGKCDFGIGRASGCQCRSSNSQVPEIIDLVFAKTSPKRSFCMTENERFGLVFVKTGSINSDTGFDPSIL